MAETEYSLGIDIGTTFSAAAISTADTTEVFSLGARTATIPSVVVVREHGEVLVGEAAQRRALSDPARSAREFKRRLGDPTPIFLGGVPYGAESLTALLLRAIVEQVAERQGSAPSRIALTHPATYRDYKLDMLRLAVGQADVGEVTFVTEPDAAARYYAGQERFADGDVVAVYDFGGGTFDASVVRKKGDTFELVGTPEGMERIGGIDFDEALLAHVDESLGGVLSGLDVDDPATRTGLARLRDECRLAKEALSSDTDVSIPVSLPGLSTEVRVTRAGFEALVRPRVGETVEALRRAVRSTGLGMDEVARVLLVGGTSHIPLVRQLVREATARPVALDAHPKHSVSLGAAELVRPRHGGANPVIVPPVLPDLVREAPPVAATNEVPTTPGRVRPPRGRSLALLVPLAALLIGGLSFLVTRGGGDKVHPAPAQGNAGAGGPAVFGDVGVTLGVPRAHAKDLVVPVELHNRLTTSQVLLGSLRYTLRPVAGGPIVGSDRLATQSVPAGTSSHADVVFPGAADRSTDGALLTIDAPGKEPLTMGLRGGSTTSPLPRTLTSTGLVHLPGPTATLTYSVKSAVLSLDERIEEGSSGKDVVDRRADLGKAFLSLSVSLTANACTCPGGVNWSSQQLRLTVDGMSVAPWTSTDGVVAAAATVEFKAGFVVAAHAKQAVLHVGGSAADPSAQITIALR